MSAFQESIELILASVVFAITGQILLKVAMNAVGPISLDPGSLPDVALRVAQQHQLWIGFVFNGLAAALWIYVLSRVELSYAHPFQAANIVLTVIIARLVLHEPVSAARWAAIVLIGGGLTLVSLS